MDEQELQQPLLHQIITNRFIAACNADDRVVAAFIGGSYARGKNDAYSDLDFGIIITDETYEYFLVDIDAFIRLLDYLVLLEDFNVDSIDTFFFFFYEGNSVE